MSEPAALPGGPLQSPWQWRLLCTGFVLSVVPLATVLCLRLPVWAGISAVDAIEPPFGDIVAAAALTGIGIVLFALGVHRAVAAQRRRHSLELRAHQRCQEALAELTQSRKMAAVGRLTGGIAHDFNNLLQIIGNDIGLLESCLTSGDMNIQGYLSMAKRSVARATAVTQRLLAFSRHELPAPALVDLNELVRDTAELLRPAFHARMHIRLDLGSGVGQVLADASELETALLNLAANARDAMRQFGELTLATANVTFDEAHPAQHPRVAPGRYVMIAATDTGVGMSEEVIEHALDPFFTTKKVGEGTGLGLSQVQEFIRNAKGHIEIQSEPGRGTTVRLYLPQAAPAVTALAEPPVAEPHVARDTYHAA